MSEIISPSEFIEVMRESFSRGQVITFTPTGSSMLPLLDGKHDTVTLSPKPERLNKYDVAFYLRPDSGQLVLHRLIGFTKDGGYIFCGDNQRGYEYGIGDADILALMTSFTHNGREYQMTDASYRRYVRRMMAKKRFKRTAVRAYRALFRESENNQPVETENNAEK